VIKNIELEISVRDVNCRKPDVSRQIPGVPVTV
jgi:hypothetical protein